MTFRNSILAGEDLVRTGIRSPNYVAGVSGWRIARDGSAEFLDVLIRGEMRVINPLDPDQYVALDILGGLPALVAATGDVDEDAPGRLLGVVSGAGGTRNLVIDLASGNFTGGDRGRIVLRSESEDGSEPSRVQLDAAELEVDANVAFSVTDTTDASGFVTFNHGASTTPKIVLVTHEAPLSGPAVFCSGVDSIGATTARARFLEISAGTVVSRAAASVTFRVLTLV